MQKGKAEWQFFGAGRGFMVSHPPRSIKTQVHFDFAQSWLTTSLRSAQKDGAHKLRGRPRLGRPALKSGPELSGG